ncbi:MAG: hypothetical protein ACPLRW_07210 [Moorellales bacterium]
MIRLRDRLKRAVLILAVAVPLVTAVPSTPQFAWRYGLHFEQYIYAPDRAAIEAELEYLYAVLPGLERLNIRICTVGQTGQVLGLYDTQTNTIYIYALTATKLWYFPWFLNCWSIATAHEVGHAVWFRAFTEAERREYVRLTGATDPVEGFAEDFRLLFGSERGRYSWPPRPELKAAEQVRALIVSAVGGEQCATLNGS